MARRASNDQYKDDSTEIRRLQWVGSLFGDAQRLFKQVRPAMETLEQHRDMIRRFEGSRVERNFIERYRMLEITPERVGGYKVSRILGAA